MPSDVDNHGRPIWTPFAGAVATSGKTHGVETVLRQNIAHSEYYRKLCRLDANGTASYLRGGEDARAANSVISHRARAAGH